MNTFWIFLFGILVGIILYNFVQIAPKKSVIRCIMYTLDVYICFQLASYVASTPNLFTSFLTGVIASQLFLIVTHDYSGKHPFMEIKNCKTRLPCSDPALSRLSV